MSRYERLKKISTLPAPPTPSSDINVDTNNLKDDISDSVESIKTNTQIVIQKSNLPEAQQSILTTFGFGENIVITPEMQACAEAKLGAERLAEIVAGATPSFMEASSLVVCLRN